MHYLPFIGILLFLAFVAPLRVTLIACVCVLLVTFTVRASSSLLADVTVSYWAAFKSVVFAFLFFGIALFAIKGFSGGVVTLSLDSLSGLATIGVVFAAYSAGFMLALDVTFIASVLIAVVSTVISGLAFWGLGRIL